MKIFISWSGERSKLIAEEFKQWLPLVIQAAEPFFSPEDINKGERWRAEISTKLEECHVGIFCITPENHEAPWLLFEAGAISKHLSQSRVCAIFFDLSPTEITGPLTQFQGSTFQKEEIYKVLQTINSSASETGQISSEILRRSFDTYWPYFEKKIQSIIAIEGSTPKDKASRTQKDMVEEILSISRYLQELPSVRQQISQGELLDEVRLLIPQVKDFLISKNKAESFISNDQSLIALGSSKNFYERTFVLHLLTHQARDMCLMSLPTAPVYNPPQLVEGQRAKPHPLLESNRDKIITLLEKTARIFQYLAPEKTNIWTCLRDRRADDKYHTFARAGIYNPYREETSTPLAIDSKVVQRLRDTYRDGCCVLITGMNEGPQMWEEQNNDKYGEDRTVVLGAILTKSWDEKDSTWINNKLAWILGISASTEDAFGEIHIPLMQTCVITFSMLANSIMRSDKTGSLGANSS